MSPKFQSLISALKIINEYMQFHENHINLNKSVIEYIANTSSCSKIHNYATIKIVLKGINTAMWDMLVFSSEKQEIIYT